MTGRYFRDNADYNAGPTRAKGIARMLGNVRQNMTKASGEAIRQLQALEVHLSNKLKAQSNSVTKTSGEVVRQLQALEVCLSDTLRIQPNSMTAEVALEWIEETLRKVEDKYPGIDNLCGSASFEEAYINIYAAYEAVVRQVVADYPEHALVEFLESILVTMDELADRVAVREECQRPMPDSPKNGKNQVDWLKLLTSEEA